MNEDGICVNTGDNCVVEVGHGIDLTYCQKMYCEGLPLTYLDIVVITTTTHCQVTY